MTPPGYPARIKSVLFTVGQHFCQLFNIDSYSIIGQQNQLPPIPTPGAKPVPVPSTGAPPAPGTVPVPPATPANNQITVTLKFVLISLYMQFTEQNI